MKAAPESMPAASGPAAARGTSGAACSRRGRFISLEGGEGAGKTTNLALVRRLIEARGHDVLATREPGGTPLAEAIRELVLARREEAVDGLAETLLVFAARAQHIAAVIEPALRAGRWVLCDRFTDSTFAYQGGGRGVDVAVVERLAALVHGTLWPDLTIYLDVPDDVGRGRIAGREPDRFEIERREFFRRVRVVFRDRARAHARIQEVDASRPLVDVQRDVAAVMQRFLDAS